MVQASIVGSVASEPTVFLKFHCRGFDGRQSEILNVLGLSGLGLALGALQQGRGERLAARGIAAQPGQQAAVAIDFDAAPPGVRVLGLHHLAAAAVELGRADERVHLNVCATRHLAEGEKRLRRGHQHREVAGNSTSDTVEGSPSSSPPEDA